jgi:3-oxoacyl-[acyl-carrier protein] reductase
MVTPARELEGQIALITGGAKNIGAAICRELADAGAKVCVNALSSTGAAEAVAADINARGGDAMVHIADVSDKDAVVAMMAAIERRFGGLTILVNNAAVRRLCPLADMTLEEFRAIQSANVEGPFLCAQAALPIMAKSGGGTIVNIGGLTGHTGVRDRLHVSVSKAALNGLTVALAHEGAPFDVTANLIVPGSIDTERPLGHRHAPGYLGNDNLLGRKGRPEEIAGMVRMVCGPAGRYITAQTIHVNGGAYLSP